MKFLQRRLLAIASVLALVAAGVAPAVSAQPSTDSEYVVSAAWLAERIGNPAIAVVDVRPTEAYSHGHIPGAINLPWQKLAQPNTDESQIGRWQEQTIRQLGSVGITPGDMVVSYDDSGNLFAARMRWVLTYLGHADTAVLDGGLPAWAQLGESLSTEATTRPATTYTGAPNPELLATWAYVLDRIGNPDVQILDVRPHEAYTGDAAGTDLHAGHIPGALNLDWNTLVAPEVPRTYINTNELQAAFDSVGLNRDKEIIVYCVSGVASANALLTLEMLGYPNVRLYSASWTEWGNREDLPFVTGSQPGV